MTRFRFRLKTVLKMRQQEERQQQRRVAEVVRIREHFEGRLRELGEAKHHCVESLRALAETGGLDMRRIASVRYYGSQLDFQQVEIHEKLRLVDQELERRRLDLAEASKQRQIIEKLRDRQVAEHRRSLEKRQQAVLDEVGNVQFVRKSKEADLAPHE